MNALAKDFLADLLAGAGIVVPPAGIEKLLLHAAEMLRWNRAIRLTAITIPEEVAVKHILDSLLLLSFAPFPGRTLDFGSGAGYPGVPLAIALPGSQFVLLESSGKKCAFLSHVRSALGLENVSVVEGRLAKKSPLSLGRFERIVTRATLPPGDAVDLLVPCLAPGGRLLLMTGPGEKSGPAGKGGRERPAAKEPLPPGAKAGRSRRFSLPLGMGNREIREILAPE